MNHTFQTPTPPRLDLRIPAGGIEIEAVETGETEVRLDGPAEVLDGATVELRGDAVFVEVRDRKGLFNLHGVEVRLHVRCPEGAAASVRTKSADVSARGRLAKAHVASASGDVELERVEGDASFETASGDVAIAETGGDVTVHTASGDVDLGRVGGRLRANLVSGDVRARAVEGSVTVNVVSGDVEVGEVVAGTVTVQSVSGDVEIGVRRGSRVHVDANTLSGTTHSELELGDAPVGGGGPLVELRVKTVSGDVSVVRAVEVTQS